MSRDIRFDQIAPVFPVTDLDRSISHYQALGFTVTRYEGGEDYAFAKLDAVRLHLWQTPSAVDPETNFSCAFIEVSDADALAQLWSHVSDSAAVRSPTRTPIDTEYGLREGAHVDPDGNLLRFAHKITPDH